MIKTKLQYKKLNDSHPGIAGKLTVLALDGWCIAAPIWKEAGGGIKALIYRNVKVTKDNLSELIMEDLKSDINQVKVDDDTHLYGAMEQEKVLVFIDVTAERYKIEKSKVSKILVDNLEEFAWRESDQN